MRAGTTVALVGVLVSLSGCSDGPGGLESGDTLTFESVSAGGLHTCGLATSGAYCWGSNGRGQLGIGTSSGPETCNHGQGDFSCSTAPVAVTGELTFSAVTAGSVLTCGLTTGGAPYCWGGNNAAGVSSVPLAVPGGHEFSAVTVGGALGHFHACGLTTSGRVYCWGLNDWGQLGNGSPSSYNSVPAAVTGGLAFSAVTAGAFHTCGLTTSGTAYCWGFNELGQLGDGSTTSYSSVPVVVAGGLTFSSLSALFYHTCGLTASGKAYCWGVNGGGQLGDGSLTSSSVPVAVTGGLTFSALSVGAGFTCGLTVSGEAYCWGWNAQGRLGTGVDTGPDQCVDPRDPSRCTTRPVAVVGGFRFRDLSAGTNHTCGITVRGIAYCWGWNGDGQLGTGDSTGPEQCGEFAGVGPTIWCSTRPVAVAGQAVVP